MPKTKSSTKAKSTAKTPAKPSGKTTTKAAAAPVVRTTVTRTSVAAKSRSNYKAILSRRLNGDLSLGALFAELAGTFVLTVLLLNTNGNAIIAGLTVVIFTIVLGRLSGAHLNPAITLALFATKQISAMRSVAYIVAQVLGAMLALVVVSQFIATTPETMVPSQFTGEMVPAQKQEVFKVAELVGDWRPLLAEALGAIVLGLGVAAAKFTRREGLEAGFAVGGALLLGLLVATYQGTTAILNPAVALGLDAYKADTIWMSLTVYAIGPIVGAAAGAWLFRLLQWDTEGTSPTSKETA